MVPERSVIDVCQHPLGDNLHWTVSEASEDHLGGICACAGCECQPRRYVAVDALLSRVDNLGGFDTSARAPRGAFYVKRDDVRSIISELSGRINA